MARVISNDNIAIGKSRAPRNRTLNLSIPDEVRLRARLVTGDATFIVPNSTVHGDFVSSCPRIPDQSIDLVVLDPPYNLDKSFNGRRFAQRPVDEYTTWLDAVLAAVRPKLRDTASIYICGDWLSSASIYQAAAKFFVVRNRITWEREKGRGAAANWKNSSEDIWFCTVGNEYVFNVDAVRLRRRVIAPYTHDDGKPKDWSRSSNGNFRDTCPSNFWSDITVPFWSMPENTDHPTQKSEKLFAKLILASSRPNDLVLDPFAGSGTTSVVAKKLGRRYIGIEVDEEYCLLAERRLEIAETDRTIQGFTDGVFWERNSQPTQAASHRGKLDLFDE